MTTDEAFDFVKTLPLSDTTKSKYNSNLRKLFNITKKDIKGSFEDISIFQDFAVAKNKAGKFVLNTNYTTIDTLTSFIEKYKLVKPNIITDENFEKIINIRNNLRSESKKTVYKQLSKTDITLEECYELMDSYDKDSLEYLFIACNLLLPPRRSDWNKCIFVEELPEELEELNYVVIGEKVKLVFNNYKDHVQKILGTWTITLDNSKCLYFEDTNNIGINLEKLGQLLINSYNKNKRKYVFEENIDRYNKFISKVLKKYNTEMKQTFFRNIILNKFYELNTSAETKLAFAHDMGQTSLETQMLYTEHTPNKVKQDNIINEYENNYLRSKRDLQEQFKILQKEIKIIQDKMEENDKEYEMFLKLLNKFKNP